MGHQVIKLQNPLKTLGFLQFYRFKTVKDRILRHYGYIVNFRILNPHFFSVIFLHCLIITNLKKSERTTHPL